MVGHMNNMIGNKFSPFTGAGFAVFQATFPFQRRPAVIVVLRQFAEDAFEINLPVTQRTEAARAVDPGLIAAIDATLGAGGEFRVFNR